MIWQIAWRNVWRNKIRSLTVILAVFFGMFGGIFSDAIMNGAINQRIKSAIQTETSHIQLHNPDFLFNNEQKYIIENEKEIINKISSFEEVKSICKRQILTGMANTYKTGTGIEINAIIPSEERKVTNMYDKLEKGTYFDSKTKNAILISQKLSEKLDADLKSKVVLTFQDKDNNITGGAFKVVGIYSTDNAMFDQMNVFVNINDLNKITGFSKSDIHEIAILLNDNEQTKAVEERLEKEYPGLDIKEWKDLQPELGMMADMITLMLYVVMVIIMLALAFGIINTMLMVVLERTKELGMLMSIGMNRMRVFSMIMLETVFLSFTGGGIGIIVSFAFVKIFEKSGIELSGYSEGFEAIGYSSTIYPDIEPIFYLNIAVLVIMIAILASVYPAIRALKLNPVEATRTD